MTPSNCLPFLSDLSVEASRWRYVQVAGVSRVSVPDAAGPLPPQQLGFSICKSTSDLLLLLAAAEAASPLSS